MGLHTTLWYVQGDVGKLARDFERTCIRTCIWFIEDEGEYSAQTRAQQQQAAQISANQTPESKLLLNTSKEESCARRMVRTIIS